MTICGDLELCYGGLAVRSALRLLHIGGDGFLVQLWPAPTAGVEDADIPEEIRLILANHEQVFQPLSGLPPHHHYDHAINLKEGFAQFKALLLPPLSENNY